LGEVAIVNSKKMSRAKSRAKGKPGRKMVGAALVVGGGPAGVQSALDLANSGFKTYLVEVGPSIGGTMAQLDKTFPTNDCSMCIISPKMSDCIRHPDIELMTRTSLQSVEGKAGNFTVNVLRKAIFVDASKCNGCGECVPVCPVNLPNEFDAGMATRKAVYRPFPQAVPGIFTIDRRGIAPCTDSCPGGLSAQGYVALVAEGKFKEALDLVRETIPFPSVCGRICHHPCEDACNRREIDSPVSMAALKSFVGDLARDTGTGSPPQVMEAQDGKVAIVGAGPAGLTAAYQLARRGFRVEVFEATDKPGGMLWWGVPEYRLPKDVLENDVDHILKAGVEIQYDVKIGEDVSLDQLREEYDAVFVAIGAHKNMKLGIEGEELDGVIHSTDFLRSVARGKAVPLGKRVAVAGGGNAAMDAVRTAMRLGSEPFILYRRTIAEMPAIRSEIEAARSEGVEMHFLVSPVRIVGENGLVKAIECVRMELGDPDESGRRKPIPVKGSEFTIDVDNLILAIGQSPDLESLGHKSLTATKWGTIEVDPENLSTSKDGIFAGGDAVTGPATAVEAIAAGNKAAKYIEKYLKGESIEPDSEESDSYVVSLDDVRERMDGVIPSKERVRRETIDMQKRRTTFEEIESVLTAEQAVDEAARCLSCGPCSMCGQCAPACKLEAIDYNMKDEVLELKVGAIVLAPGFSVYDTSEKVEYGHGVCPNVLTNLEFERMLSASGPTQGHIIRPSDQHEPRSIAFIQCIGSRDAQTPNTYCSSYCCMAALKEAVVSKEHAPGVEVTIFFMDTRAFGKGFEEYLHRAENEYGVRVVRNNRVPKVSEDSETHNLTLIYHAGPDIKDEDFEMVVLSAGARPPASVETVAGATGIRLNKFGFCEVDELSPVESSVPGIFVCGAMSGPKDIPDSIAQASGAAGKVAALLADERGKLVSLKEYPVEKDLLGQDPRIGVFVCHCGINIGSVVDVPSVVEYASRLPNVAYAEENLYTCSADSLRKIGDAIEAHDLNRLVVAACTPRTHEPLFQNVCREAGLNKYLFEMANIRDQCSWVHKQEPAGATNKAKTLVKMAVVRSAMLQPLQQTKVPVTPVALVIGGGLSGMTAALEIAEAGYQVHLVEKTGELGGHMRDIYHTLSGVDPQKTLEDLEERLGKHGKVVLHMNDEVSEVKGYVGNFESALRSGETIKHGTIIVATGAIEYNPTEHLHGSNPKVIKQTELGSMLARGEFDAENVVIIQCVGSRDDEHPNCSRICCSTSMANVVKLKREHPDTNVFVLFRDIRTFGFWEEHYNEAARLGVMFLRFDPSSPPEVIERDGNLYVEVVEQFIEQPVRIRADYAVLNAAVHPNPNNAELARMLKVPLTEEGYFLEAHMKLRPVDFATDGIFLCGLAHSPRLIGESISQALAAAARANTVLSREYIEAEGFVSVVDDQRCSGCGTCVEVCPYGALAKGENGLAEVVAAACKGCGCCAATCPETAISIANYSDEQVLAMARAALEGL
jgi:heterodisulfide reductase subunit A-like polyferredoxin